MNTYIRTLKDKFGNLIFPRTRADGVFLMDNTTKLDTELDARDERIADPKVTPVDADFIGIRDSADLNKLKKTTWGNIKATLKSYFDTQYNNYTLPTASTTTLGGVKVDGTTVTITDGVISADSVDTTSLGTTINSAAVKATPVDADSLGLVDSAASNVIKKLTWANVKATLKSYFDTLYPSMTTSNITYYVATTGSNSNDGLSAGSPFLTIAYALSKIPKNVRYSVTINVASGTYNETIYVTGFFGNGSIQIFGGTDLASSVNYKVSKIDLTRNTCYVYVRGFEVTNTIDHSVVAETCLKVLFQFITTTGNATSYNGFYIDGSKVRMDSCVASNKSSALYALDNSDVFSYNWTSGSGNTTGISARNGAKVAKLGTQPQGTTPESCANGAIVTSGVLNPAPLDTPTFINPSGTTQALGNNSTYLATTAFVVREIKADERPIQLALSDETTTLTTGTGKLTFRMPYACKFTKIPRINLNTVSSSGLVTVDIKKNGTTIFSTLLTIDANEKTSVTATTPCVLSSNPTTFADDDEITFDITVAGTGAKGLKATLFVEKV